ncbi:hypothetical protein OEW28_04180 [Defluviimonas sp. WL0002]|uniref:Uncharacterized protein n=1 Tax=Albidovulum marisflavi TaxID=2984159 RepID=A0ABT2Z9V3_9RHOB|nr:hypothetical protein [Defluviimonas sp. WL0002]MCV2867817.1 hypothetical protein [Defluviimonas sp. WL0002]
MRRNLILFGLAAAGALVAGGLAWHRLRRDPTLPPARRPMPRSEFQGLYDRPLAPPSGPLRVFHLGHSLVGHDMPAMLAQLAGPGHRYESQIGRGTTLRAHWEDDIPIEGYAEDNAHGRFRPAKEALESSDYDAFIMTERVDIRTSIREEGSAAYVALWAELARRGNPDTRVYLYETWNWLSVEDGWLERMDGDLPRYWIDDILRGAAAYLGGAPIYVIPAGQVLGRVTRAAEAGQVAGIASREDFFARTATGELDRIHIGDLGAFVVALAHHAVLYRTRPPGLDAEMRRADGTPADLPDELDRAALWSMIEEVVGGLPETGVGRV